MLANFLIGLREGLEAALVVVVLLAYVAKLDRRDLRRWIWVGVSLAVLLAVIVSAVITFGTQTLTFQAQEILEGVLSLIAVGFITWMVLWIGGAGTSMSQRLREGVDARLDGHGWGLVLLAFVSVAREGLETALLIVPAATAYGLDDPRPFIAAGAGILTAVALGVGLRAGIVRIDLGLFFRITSIALVFVAAGMLGYGLHAFQEAAVLPGLHQIAWHLGGALPPDSIPGALLGGLLNYTPEPTWLMVIAWIAYVVIVLTILLRRSRNRSAAPAAPTSPTHP